MKKAIKELDGLLQKKGVNMGDMSNQVMKEMLMSKYGVGDTEELKLNLLALEDLLRLIRAGQVQLDDEILQMIQELAGKLLQDDRDFDVDT